MRPRKTILLAGECEERISTLAFALGLKTFTVTTASTAADALELLRKGRFELLLVDLPLSGAARLCDVAAASDLRIPSLILGTNTEQDSTDAVADARMIRQRDRTDLLERLKVMTARKRGPKERKPVASAPAPVILAARCAS